MLLTNKTAKPATEQAQDALICQPHVRQMVRTCLLVDTPQLTERLSCMAAQQVHDKYASSLVVKRSMHSFEISNQVRPAAQHCQLQELGRNLVEGRI